MSKVVTIFGNPVAQGADGLRVAFATCNSVRAIAKALQQILPKARYTVLDCLNATRDDSAIEVEAPRDRPELTEQCLRDAVGLIGTALTEYQMRYGEAVAARRPVRRLPLDSPLACLNRTLWMHEQAGGRTVLAPDTNFAEDLRGIDPQLLMAAAPDQGEDLKIHQALIVGCREIYRNQGDLFRADDEVEVLVSLVGAIPEVQLRTTRAEAQQLYRGSNRMTANIRTAGRGAAPEVVGEYTIAE